ncbi:hypothetical protein B0T17DRAFT_506247 [Bombardia bombarda]|uniref:Uncharacterized protein n=1 Tax=Bombardia bombarda TaxID=252184 RepID=A0AA40CA01_9PEZI|nr:hypothetical protein B0T17DRAFT_506247 [Bombardia bombarda]
MDSSPGLYSNGAVSPTAGKSSSLPLGGTTTTTTTTSTASPSDTTAASPIAASPAPPGHHTMRRAMTVDEAAYLRRRPTFSQLNPQLNPEPSFDDPRRRSSTFSEYSLTDARRNLQEDILNPGGAVSHSDDRTWWSSLPLIFALLPAIGGILFKNGSSVITDLILLCLAAVFLNWSVTQPWAWYHSAQEVRVREEMVALEEDSDMEETPEPSGRPGAALERVPEEQGGRSPSRTPQGAAAATRRDLALRSQKALSELYMHEVFALLACFTAPVMGAILLHTIRNQLSRPSESLVSNFSLTIFVLTAEIGPLSHLIKLVRARTLHLQKIVQSNLYGEEILTRAQWQELVGRINELEVRAAGGTAAAAANGSTKDLSRQQGKQEAHIVREVRNSIQPELDALNRAVRRYEKKATVLAYQTESRLGAIDTRLNDAISLAAAAAKNSSSDWNFLGWLFERLLWAVMLPFSAIMGLVMLLFRTVFGVFGRNKKAYREKNYGDRRSGRGASSSGRLSSSDRDRDRVPTRLSRR